MPCDFISDGRLLFETGEPSAAWLSRQAGRHVVRGEGGMRIARDYLEQFGLREGSDFWFEEASDRAGGAVFGLAITRPAEQLLNDKGGSIFHGPGYHDAMDRLKLLGKVQSYGQSPDGPIRIVYYYHNYRPGMNESKDAKIRAFARKILEQQKPTDARVVGLVDTAVDIFRRMEQEDKIYDAASADHAAVQIATALVQKNGWDAGGAEYHHIVDSLLSLANEFPWYDEPAAPPA